MNATSAEKVRRSLLVETTNSVSKLMREGLTFDESYRQACAERHLSEEEIRDFRKKAGILLKVRRIKKQHAGSKNTPDSSGMSPKKTSIMEEQIPLFGGNTYLD